LERAQAICDKPVKTHTKVFTTAKAGNSTAENQDSFGHPLGEDGYCSQQEQRFAVADGATEAIFSGIWASLLTAAWSEGHLSFEDDRYTDLLGRLGATWLATIQNQSLAWWAEEKLAYGAYSTLAGLSIIQDDSGVARWRFSTVGDSCFFLIRANQVVVKSPLTESIQFSSSPYLIGSSKSQHSSIGDHLLISEGELNSGDELILATDAISCWLMQQLEQGAKPSDLLLFRDHENSDFAFLEFVGNARANERMRNDDVTLMSILIL